VHCVNNVMQAPLFVHEDFAKVARHLDARERYLLDGDYMASEDGFNHRADGFFNVQVIRAALQDRGFGMEPLTGETMKAALAEPAKQQGFICNKEEHWFALRRIGGEWFDLNSCLNEPRHRTNAQLDATVRQTIKDGYNVFVVTGTYPPLEPSQLQALKEAMQKKDRENPTGKKRKTKAKENEKPKKLRLEPNGDEAKDLPAYWTWAMRQKQLEEFHAMELDNIAALENLKSAIVVLDRHQGSAFPQMDATSTGDWAAADVTTVRKALTSADAFMQSKHEHMPSYNAQSDEIFFILKQVQDQMKAGLSDAQQTEASRAASFFAELRSAKTSEIESGEKMAKTKAPWSLDEKRRLSAAVANVPPTQRGPDWQGIAAEVATRTALQCRLKSLRLRVKELTAIERTSAASPNAESPRGTSHGGYPPVVAAPVAMLPAAVEPSPTVELADEKADDLGLPVREESPFHGSMSAASSSKAVPSGADADAGAATPFHADFLGDGGVASEQVLASVSASREKASSPLEESSPPASPATQRRRRPRPAMAVLGAVGGA
jgi:ataxin-3